MKKRMLAMLMAMCLMLTLVPVALAEETSDLQTLIDEAVDGSTISLSADYTITDTVTINKGLTIVGNGHSITIDAAEKAALSVNTNSTVQFNNVTVNAVASGGVGIDLTSSSPQITLTSATLNVNSRGIRFISNEVFSGASVILDASHILNSQITSGDYANETTVGDTRGIGLYGVENSTITMRNSSSIKGFGYSINTSADVGTNGIRPASNTFNITNSSIWGWSAVNIWTVGNTFNFTNCDLRGINPLNTLGNSFSVINITRGIYGSDPTSAAPNVFNIVGGSMDAKMTVDTSMVEETLMSLEEELVTEYHFSKYQSGRRKYPVTLTCDKPFAAIVYYTESGVDTNNALQTWIDSNKFSGSENTTYNRTFLVGSVVAGNAKMVTTSIAEPFAAESSRHEGGAEA